MACNAWQSSLGLYAADSCACTKKIHPGLRQACRWERHPKAFLQSIYHTEQACTRAGCLLVSQSPLSSHQQGRSHFACCQRGEKHPILQNGLNLTMKASPSVVTCTMQQTTQTHQADISGLMILSLGSLSDARLAAHGRMSRTLSTASGNLSVFRKLLRKVSNSATCPAALPGHRPHLGHRSVSGTERPTPPVSKLALDEHIAS